MVALGDNCGLLSLIGLADPEQTIPVKDLARGSGPSVRQTRIGLQAGH